MKRIKEIVIVEGKTDTQLLKELYDVDTIETHGLALDDKTLELIKEASLTRGVIVLTDPDYPGLKIRNQVDQVVDNCKHAFVDKKDAIGKKKLGIAEANKEAVKKAIVDHCGVYFGAIGGAGAMMSSCIEECEIIAFDDLGPEAIRKLKVKNMPLVVVIDHLGNDLYEIGRKNYLKNDCQ